jgi:hypothetical protein
VNFLTRIRRIFGLHKDESESDRIRNSYIDSEAISSLSSAYIKLENNLGLKSTGRCGICVKKMDIDSFEEMKQYIDNFLTVASDKNKNEFDITFRSLVDEYGYLWFIIVGKLLEDIVAAINAIGDTIHEKGFSVQLLANIFEFTTGYGSEGKNSNINNDEQYLIYNYKLDKFYPFVPIGSESPEGTKRRNHEQEKKIMNEISGEIKFEKDMSLWYPIWNLPF